MGYWIGLAIALASGIIAIITIIVVKRRIKAGYYIKKRKAPIVTPYVVVFAMLIAKTMRNQRLLMLGIGGTLCVLASASNVYFLMIYYGYKLIENICIPCNEDGLM